ncbi:MAG: flagellar protein FlaG [Firmicutes bacterium]|nr:flagellar protein FlaG [Bacillota bacterium]
MQGVDNGYTPLRQDIKERPVFRQDKQGANLEEVKGLITEQSKEETEEYLEGQKLEQAVELANKTMETYSTELRFSIHEASGEVMVKVVNTKDDTVIREIPPERVLDMVAHVKKMLGIILDRFI